MDQTKPSAGPVRHRPRIVVVSLGQRVKEGEKGGRGTRGSGRRIVPKEKGRKKDKEVVYIMNDKGEKRIVSPEQMLKRNDKKIEFARGVAGSENLGGINPILLPVLGSLSIRDVSEEGRGRKTTVLIGSREVRLKQDGTGAKERKKLRHRPDGRVVKKKLRKVETLVKRPAVTL